jgi:hypothetical protein
MEPNGAEKDGGAVDVDGLEKGGGGTPLSRALSACNLAFMSLMRSLGASTSGTVCPNPLAMAPALAGAKGTKAGLWYDKRRGRACGASVSCRLALSRLSTRGATLPDASGPAIVGTFGGTKGTKSGLWYHRCKARGEDVEGISGLPVLLAPSARSDMLPGASGAMAVGFIGGNRGL